jgi:hypothetical protein
MKRGRAEATTPASTRLDSRSRTDEIRKLSLVGAGENDELAASRVALMADVVSVLRRLHPRG